LRQLDAIERLGMRPVINLSEWRLDPSGPLLRKPPRPPAYRGPGYEQSFDFTTVFCDAFWSADGRRIVLIGPPLLSQRPDLIIPEVVSFIAEIENDSDPSANN